MVTALSVTAEIIGPRTERSAIVYSIVTFLDKVVTGLVVISIERWWGKLISFEVKSGQKKKLYFFVFQEVHGTSVLSKLQQRHSGSRLRPLHVFGTRYVIFSFAMFNIRKSRKSHFRTFALTFTFTQKKQSNPPRTNAGRLCGTFEMNKEREPLCAKV